MRRLLMFLASVLIAAAVFAAERYNGPRPPKADVPYIVHADNLVETDAGEAKEEKRKDDTIAVLDGTTAKARTPIAEPMFLLKSEKILPDKMEAYKLLAKDGRREVIIGSKKTKNVQRPIYLALTKLDDRLYRIEVDEPLENGEYCLTPQGSNTTFAFSIY
jgi:hypothetical protein